MKAYEIEASRYLAQNEMAEVGGVVIFGGASDKEIPVDELKRYFDLRMNINNRSFDGLTCDMAVSAYDECVAELLPESVLIHIGEADLDRFEKDADGFIRDYRALIAHIRKLDRHCAISVIALKNPENSEVVAEMNRQLKHLADSERCTYGDIDVKRVWNPETLRETVSFLYSTGFVRPLASRMPEATLIRMLYGFEGRFTPEIEIVREPARLRRVLSPMAMPGVSYI